MNIKKIIVSCLIISFCKVGSAIIKCPGNNLLEIKKPTRFDLITQSSIPRNIVVFSTGCGLIGYQGVNSVTRGSKNTVKDITLYAGLFGIVGYLFKRGIYDEFKVMISYQKNIKNLMEQMQILKEKQLPELKEKNQQLLFKIQEQEAVVSVIQGLVNKIMATDEKILEFQVSLTDELKEVQKYLQEYKEIKEEVSAQGLKIIISGEDKQEEIQNLDDEDSCKFAEEKKIKKHGKLKKLKEQLFGSSSSSSK